MALERDQLRDFIGERTGPTGLIEIADEELLFSTGLLDSFVMVDLLVFVEQAEGTRIKASEVTLENFDSVERLMRFVARRRA